MATIERPLDFLNHLKNEGNKILVERRGKDSRPITGKLLAFDIHLNLIIETNEKAIFIRGDAVETVAPSS